MILTILGYILTYIQGKRLEQLKEKFERLEVAIEAVEKQAAGGGSYMHYDIEKNQFVYII